MFLESGNVIEGDAAVANKVDYTITGYRMVGGNPTEFATTGQLPSSKGTLYTVKSGEKLRDISIMLVNGDTSDRAVSLYLKTDGTNSRYIVNSLSLAANGGTLIICP